MTVNLSLLGGAGWQFFTDNGTPLAGGLLYTYLAGTSTAATTYTTSAGNVPNSNPIVLNSAGRVQTEIWLTQGVSYKFVLKTSAFITIGTYDNIAGAADPADIYAALAASSGSSLVGFIQSGSGAVATTVQAKLRESVSVKDFGAVGDGVTDDTAAIQAAINAASAGQEVIITGVCAITATINLKSGVNIRGGGTLTTAAQTGNFAFFTGTGVSNVDISGLTFNGGGSWTATGFPYYSGTYYGFTNDNSGIELKSGCSDIRIHDNVFTGIGFKCVNANGVTGTHQIGIQVNNNYFKNNGQAAVVMNFTDNSCANGNVIDGVYGNLASSAAVSKYADGILIYSCFNLTASNNTIRDIIRIGIVLEGDGATGNGNIVVSGNSISNFHDCKDSEYNCGIWNEIGKSGEGCVVIGNSINNKDAVAGVRAPIGIEGREITVVGNNVESIELGIGIKGVESKVIGNSIHSCYIGIQCDNQSPTGRAYYMNNHIHNNGGQGIYLNILSKGTFSICGNIIENNGQSAGLAVNEYAGIGIDGYYNNQKVVITGNTFVTSAIGADVTGQLYGIMGQLVIGADFPYTLNYITNNTFLCNSTPTAIDSKPCAFGYWDTVGAVDLALDGLLLPAGNTTSKSPTGGFFYSTTGVALADKTSDANGINKFIGKAVWNTTTNEFVYAVGATDTSHWFNAVGADTITPV